MFLVCVFAYVFLAYLHCYSVYKFEGGLRKFQLKFPKLHTFKVSLVSIGSTTQSREWHVLMPTAMPFICPCF